MPRSRPPLRVLLVGAGAMGSYHARVISANPRVELACIVDPDEATGSGLAEHFGSTWAPEVDDFAAYDAAVLACPTRHHVLYARAAVEAGTPVLVEKPVSERPEEVADLVDQARRAGIPLMCGLPERFNPAILTLSTIVTEPVHLNSVRHSPFVDRVNAGVAFDLLIHDVDLSLRMAGTMPTAVKAHVASVHPKSPDHSEDIAEVSLRFDGGMLAALSASRVSQRKIRTLEVTELERLVEVDLVRQDITVYRHVGADFLDGAHTGLRQQTVIDIVAIEHGREPLAAQLDHFVALATGEADAAAELGGVLGPHQVVADALASAGR